MAHVPLKDARYDTLAAGPQASVDDFIEGVKTKDLFGLWVYGPHRSGTTYTGRVAVKMLGKVPGVSEWEHFYAREMVDEVRSLWTMDSLLRANPTDYALWSDWTDRQAAVDYVWNTLDVLFLNDLDVEAVDISFWRKHVYARLIERVKNGRATIVATTLDPGADELMGLQKVIEDLFVVCRAER